MSGIPPSVCRSNSHAFFLASSSCMRFLLPAARLVRYKQTEHFSLFYFRLIAPFVGLWINHQSFCFPSVFKSTGGEGVSYEFWRNDQDLGARAVRLAAWAPDHTQGHRSKATTRPVPIPRGINTCLIDSIKSIDDNPHSYFNESFSVAMNVITNRYFTICFFCFSLERYWRKSIWRLRR